MKYKLNVGDVVKITNKNPKCGGKCLGHNPACPYYKQLGEIKRIRDPVDIYKKRKGVFVVGMLNIGDNCTGCSGFIQKDMKLATGKKAELYRQRLVENEI